MTGQIGLESVPTMADELKQPLHRRSTGQRLWQRRPAPLTVAFAGLFASYAIGAIWLVRQPMPLAGEPVASLPVPTLEIAQVEPPKPEKVAEVVEEPAQVKSDPMQTAAIDDAPAEPEIQKPKIIKVDKQVTVISPPRPVLVKAPAAGVTEQTPLGPLPRVAQNGRKPSEVYAKPVSMNTISGSAPKIVIILGGMGLNEKLTRKAMTSLPSDVTLAFAPYGNNLQAQVDRARDIGHEVMLQLPMEPVGYPSLSPGPKTLLATGEDTANYDSLMWHLSRFAGYVGVENYMGGRFMATAAAMKPVLNEIKRRGLYFIEDGSLPATSVDQVAGSMGMTLRHAAIVIDQAPDRASIAKALDALERQAEDGGVAIGTGSGLEETIDAVKEWAAEAQSRGIVIVPATAAFKGQPG